MKMSPLKVERVMGIEPTWPAWKAGTLPLSYTRAGERRNHNAGTCVVNSPPCILRPRMNALLLTAEKIIDPANRLEISGDLLIVDGKIAAVGAGAAAKAPANVEGV